MSENTLAAGIHAGVPMQDYINDPCEDPSLSKGVIDKLVHRSAAHAHQDHPRLSGSKQDATKRSDLGSAAHAMLLGGAEAIVFVDAKDWRTDAAKNTRDTARKENRIPMLAKEAKALDAMVSIARPILESFGAGDVENTLIWQEDNGVWGRARPDWLAEPRDTVIDYKTSKTADPDEWIRTVLHRSNYALQAGWYLRGLDVLLGAKERDFLFLVQEIEPPYCCSVVGAGPQMIELAQSKIRAALKLWRICLQSKKWPGYHPQTHWADVPEYQVWNWEARKALIAGRS